MKSQLLIAAVFTTSAIAGTAALAQTSPPIKPEPAPINREDPPPPISQDKVNEAMQKIKEKQADRQNNPTTQPADADVTPTDPAAMRAEIMRLRRQLYASRRENQTLRSDVMRLARDQGEAGKAVAAAQAATAQAERDYSNGNYDRRYDDRNYNRDWVPGVIYGGVPAIGNLPPSATHPTKQPIPAPGNAMNGQNAPANHLGPREVIPTDQQRSSSGNNAGTNTNTNTNRNSGNTGNTDGQTPQNPQPAPRERR